MEKKNYKKREGKPRGKYKPRLFKKGHQDNVLVIGDIHEPFALDGYLEFCREQQIKYNCGQVVCVGDIVDHHFSSYHETELCAMGADDEFELTVERLRPWYDVFPNMKVCIGNHDMMVYRKCKTAGISTSWMKDYNDALEVPGWDFAESFDIFGVNYNHGVGGQARTRIKSELQSQVQGHYHSQSYIEYIVGSKHRVFGMQVGCGIDKDAYAMAYGKHFKKPVISCGVVLNQGSLPILLPMHL